MAAFVDVGLVPAPVGIRLVALGDEVGNFCLWRTSVVSRENDDRIVGEILLIQLGQYFADDPVGFHQEIAVDAETGFALPFFGRHNRRVRAGERHVKKEGLLAFRSRGNVRAAFASEIDETIDSLEILRRRAGPMEGLGGVGPGGGLVVFQVQVRKHIERRGDNVGFIKADRQRPAGHLLIIINLPTIAASGAGFRGAFFTVGQHLPAKPKMPFANHCGVISLLPQKAGRCQALLFNERFGQAPEHTLLQCATPVVTAGENSIARGGTNGRRSVCVSKAHALTRQPVTMWRSSLASSMRQITITEIVCQDINDVRSLLR